MEVNAEEIDAQKRILSGKRVCLQSLRNCDMLGGLEVFDGLKLSESLK